MSNTISQNLQKLSTDKNNIINALVDKGVANAVNHGFDDFATDIASIPTSASAEGYKCIITTIPNAVVTLSKTGATYTQTANNSGIATFHNVLAGTYTVQASMTVNDFTANSDTTTIVVDDHTATEDTFATITITAPENCNITISDGTTTKTVAYLAGASIVQYANLNTTWDISATISGTLVSRTVSVSTYGNQDVNLTPTFTYGWHIDPSIYDSSNAVTYLEDAVGMTPAAMGASTFDYGSWENAFFMPKPCMLKSDGTVDYYLDPNDYSKKADGTASDIANSSYDGNAMMEFPKIWYKFAGTSTEGEGYFYVSNTQVDNTYHCWCNIDANNNEIDHFYMAIYNGTGTSKLRSLSGVRLNSSSGNGSATVTQETIRAQANNPTGKQMWYIDQWCDRLLINALLILMSKSLDTQGKYGNGLVTGSQSVKEYYVTGSLDTKGLFWGDISGQSQGIKVFGIENWWGLVWRRIMGCASSNRNLFIKLTWGTADGSTVTGYNSKGSGYIYDGSIYVADLPYYIVKMKFDSYGYMTKTASSSTSAYYYRDSYYCVTDICYLLAGGNILMGDNAGAFCFNFINAESSANWGIAAALSCKPLAST